MFGFQSSVRINVGPNCSNPLCRAYPGSLFQSSVRINVGPNVVSDLYEGHDNAVSILRED